MDVNQSTNRWKHWSFRVLCDLLFSFAVVQLYGLLTGGLWSGYIFNLGDPSLIGVMIKEHGQNWLALNPQFSEQSFFYPYKSATFFTENFIGQGLLLAPFSNSSVVFIAHLTYWASYFLSIFAMIQLLRQWTKNLWVVYLVSALWAFNPQRALTYGIVQGNFQNTWDFAILLCGWSLTLWARTNRHRWAVVALLLFWAQFFFSVVYPIVSFLIIYVAALIGSRTFRKWRHAAWLVIALSGYWILSTPYREVDDLFRVTHTIQEIQLLSHSIVGSLKLFPAPNPGGLPARFPGLFNSESILPGIFLTILALGSLRFVKSSVAVRWAWILMPLFFLVTLGPSIQWKPENVLFPNPLWIWLLEKMESLAKIRSPLRFQIGIHWILAWAAALFLDQLKLSEKVQSSRLKWAVVPVLLALLFLTDLHVPVTKVQSTELAEAVHHKLKKGSIIAEFPSTFTGEVRFRSLAIASELGVHTVDGQAAFITPLAEWLQYLTIKGMTKDTLEPLQLAGVTSIILHCHLFQEKPEFCDASRGPLEKSGYAVKYEDGKDILFETTQPRPLKMFYDSVDPAAFEYEVRMGDAKKVLVARPKKTTLLAFPKRCYPIQAVLKPSNQPVSLCYSSSHVLTLNKNVPVPGDTMAIVIYRGNEVYTRLRFPIQPAQP